MGITNLVIVVSKSPDSDNQNRYDATHNLKAGRNTIGRNPGCDIEIPVTYEKNYEVSREHAVITVTNEPENPFTIMAGSEEGPHRHNTYINGILIEDAIEVRLYPQDLISLGTGGYMLFLRDPHTTMSGPSPEIEVVGDTVRVRGEEIRHLKPRELRAVRIFLQDRGELLPYGYIYSQVAARAINQTINSKNYCHMLISQLRSKVKERYRGFLIHNEPEVGYMLRNSELDTSL